jgi:hypothetical protein
MSDFAQRAWRAIGTGTGKFAVAGAAFVGLVVASSAVGLPTNSTGAEALPGIALGWRLLFHLERAGAFMALVTAVVVIAWRGAHGEWPVSVGNVAYAPKESVAVTADALDALNTRLDTQAERIAQLEQT